MTLVDARVALAKRECVRARSQGWLPWRARGRALEQRQRGPGAGRCRRGGH